MIDLFLLTSSLLSAARAAQPSAPAPVAAPLRDLPWGQLNFLHTTDTHGWLSGHLREAQYAADWGDYISFAQHLRDRVDAEGNDLLLIDTGDRVEGSGLYDASEPKGKYIFDILKQQQLDVVTSGNHELYKQNTSDNELSQTVPDFPDSYIASNIDIYDEEKDRMIPLAPRFRKFTTKNQGIRVTAFGFLYDFNDNANSTVVQPVEDIVNEQWFQDAIKDKNVDLFLVAGHVPVRDSKEYTAIFKTIRSKKWDTPIIFFGGHTHIRDYVKYDAKSYGIESGRYLETIGFQSISGLNTGGKTKQVTSEPEPLFAGPKFDRCYIDNNLFSFYHHTQTDKKTFSTGHGRNVSAEIASARNALKLDHPFGCAPLTYWLNRVPFSSPQSLFTWLNDEVLSTEVGGHQAISRGNRPGLLLTNTGALRFDIFEGPFTRDTALLVSPFTSGFRYLKDVPADAAAKVLPLLNNEGPLVLPELGAVPPQKDASLLGLPHAPISRGRTNSESVGGGYSQGQAPLGTLLVDDEKPDLIPGYTTVDDAGHGGDDTRHSEIRFYSVPNCFSTEIGSSSDQEPETVDLIYNEFIEPWVLLALEYLGQSYKESDTAEYLKGKTFTDVITDWVQENWKCPKDT